MGDNERIVINDEALVLEYITTSDAGDYKCKVRTILETGHHDIALI